MSGTRIPLRSAAAGHPTVPGVFPAASSCQYRQNWQVTAEAWEDPDQFIAIARYDWLATRRWHFLHAVPDGSWTDQHREDMARTWGVEHPVLLACGQVAAWLRIPGLFSRSHLDGLPRCTGCCRALGFPAGSGSPKNDDRCRPLLGLPA